MSDYCVDRDSRPLLDDQQDSRFTETEVLERLRDAGSPRYGTFYGTASGIGSVAGRGPDGSLTFLPSATSPQPQPIPVTHSAGPTTKRYRLAFLILLSFDVGLIAFLSIICFLTSYPKNHNAGAYFDLSNFQVSLFDVVLTSVVRFVLDVLFYLIMGWITRIVLFITTLLSAIYIPIKGYFYWDNITEKNDNDAVLFIIVLLLLFSSFAMPWLIAFFFEFKYLPTERSRVKITTWWSYKPWLCPWMLSSNAPSSHMQPSNQSLASSVVGQTSLPPPPISASLDRYQSLDTVFRTPVGSIRGSPVGFVVIHDDDRGDLDTIREEDRRSPSPEHLPPPAECDQHSLSTMNVRYLQQGTEALQKLIALAGPDGWTQIKDQDGILCYTTQFESRKIWKSEMIIPVSADRLWTVLYHNVENTKEWNSGVALNEIIHRVDQKTDIVYILCTTIGPISPRDFVTVRRWDVLQGVYYSANLSTVHSSRPPQRDPIRGESGVSGYVVVPLAAQRCKFIWVLNSDLKGWLPQAVLDQVVPGQIVSTNKSLRTHMSRAVVAASQ